jgi:hypothetical protein
MREQRKAAVIFEMATWMEAESSSRGSLRSSNTMYFGEAMVCVRAWK